MPNMWSLYEEKMTATGTTEFVTPTSGMPLDVVVHPRDLNLLFVVYGGTY
jgi:syntaxin-binding protein 5